MARLLDCYPYSREQFLDFPYLQLCLQVRVASYMHPSYEDVRDSSLACDPSQLSLDIWSVRKKVKVEDISAMFSDRSVVFAFLECGQKLLA
jgi:hypothetical protein